MQSQPESSSGAAPDLSSVKEKKYETLFERLPKVKGLDEWYDFEQAKAVAREVKKPILIDFTGFNCVNCRKMESDVWTNPQVFNHLRNDFILLQLVVDDKAALDPKEQFTSEYSGKRITNLGGKWSDLEASRFNSNSQPLYVMLDSDGNLMNDKNGQVITPSPANYKIPSYLKYLESGLDAYKNKK